MTRWLPSPFTSLTLFAIWLLLNQSLSPAQLLGGAVFGLLGPLALRQLDLPPLSVRRPLSVIRLLGAFIADMVRSNFRVASNILRNDPARRSGFVEIPLQMRSPYGLALLACMLTAAPGTIWVSYDTRTGVLVIHVLDLHDDDDWGQIIKRRYEGLLMEIFE